MIQGELHSPSHRHPYLQLGPAPAVDDSSSMKPLVRMAGFGHAKASRLPSPQGVAPPAPRRRGAQFNRKWTLSSSRVSASGSAGTGRQGRPFRTGKSVKSALWQVSQSAGPVAPVRPVRTWSACSRGRCCGSTFEVGTGRR